MLSTKVSGLAVFWVRVLSGFSMVVINLIRNKK